MIASILQVLVLLLLPAGVWALERHSRVFRFIPTVLFCYLAGIGIGNVPGLPVDTSLSLAVCSATVALAIPLLLFSLNIAAWFGMAKSTIVSFMLCILSVVVMSVTTSFVFGKALEEPQKISAMLVGVYTGGTPNMAAIGTSLGVSPEVFVKLNAADILMGAIYLPFLFLIAPKLWRHFLPPYRRTSRSEESSSEECVRKRPSPTHLALGFTLDLLVVGTAVGLGLLLPESFRNPMILLLLTTFAIALSMHPKVRAIEGTHEMGQYALLVFCVAVGTTAKFDEMLSSSLVLLAYTAVVMFGSILLHLGMAAILRIDRDTVIITSTAAVFGSAFVGPVALSLKNREIVVAGLTTSLVGLAVGNYVGLAVGWMLTFSWEPV